MCLTLTALSSYYNSITREKIMITWLLLYYHSNRLCTSHDHYTKHLTVRPALMKEQFNSHAVGVCMCVSVSCVCLLVCICDCVQM